MWSQLFTPVRRSACALLLGAGTTLAAHAAVVQIVNGNAPGVGFNDSTPAAPVGGNPGTTICQQRLIAFRYAANIWARELKSSVPISVLATFEPLACSANSAVLGAAGAISIWSDFPGAEKPGTWYASALANKLARQDIDPGPYPDGSENDIVAFFNSDLGKPDCLAGVTYHLGLDGQVPDGQLDLISTLLHELGHGLGFQTFTRRGVQLGGQPSIWGHFMHDVAARKTWVEMTEAEGAVSSITPRSLAWDGHAVRSRAEHVLERGTPELGVRARHPDKRSLMVGTAEWGAQLDRRGVRQALGQVVDQPDGATGLACTPLSAANVRAIGGKIAVVDRGGCAFTVKAINVQRAGAVATLGLDMERLRGAAKGNRVLLYTPNPYAGGSSLSHWDTSALRNLLMEPFDNPGQPQAVRAPLDLTWELLRDIGW